MIFRLRYFWIVFLGLFTSCKEVTQEKQISAEIPKENSITLITFSMNDSLGFNTAGWGVKGYYYLNLDDDSVFTHVVDSYYKKINSIQNKSGFVSQVSQNEYVVKGIGYLESQTPGVIYETFYNNERHYYVYKCIRLIKAGHHQYFFLDKSFFDGIKSGEDTVIVSLTNFLKGLEARKELKVSDYYFDEAKVMLPLTKAKGFELVIGAPITSEIKFTPPDGLKTRNR